MAAVPNGDHLPSIRWLLEVGQSQANLGTLRDSECESGDDPQDHFLACEPRPGATSEALSGWALGFETRVGGDDDDTAASGWWAGIRLGRIGPGDLEGIFESDSDSNFSGTLRSDYALLNLRRQFQGWGPFRPHAGFGLGVAPDRLCDWQWQDGNDLRQAENGDESGFMLRASLGMDWEAPNGMLLGLEYRYDALDGISTSEGGSPEAYPTSRASLSMQTASLVLALPFGSQ